MIEIYNELIRDLLEPSDANLDLREDPVKGPTIAGMAEIVAISAREVMTLLHNGNKHRTQEATEANATSSRSHAVLQVSAATTVLLLCVLAVVGCVYECVCVCPPC